MKISFTAQLRSELRHFKARQAEVPSGRIMSEREIRMDAPEGWTLESGGKALLRTIRLKDFSETFGFLCRVAMHAEKVNHHPEFTNVWNRVDFRLTTHDSGGVTDRDIALATAINRLLSDYPTSARD